MPDRENVVKGLTELKKYLPSTMWEPINNALAMLKEQKAVVLCKDCKHGRQYDTNAVDCEYRELATEPDWFCADGERKEGR